MLKILGRPILACALLLLAANSSSGFSSRLASFECSRVVSRTVVSPGGSGGNIADERRDTPPYCVPRRAAIRASTATLAGLSAASALAAEATPDLTITHKVLFKLRIAETQAAVEGREGSPAEDGVLVFGLYGNAAPKTVANFLSYCGPAEVENPDSRPSYDKAQFFRAEPGVLLEAGNIKGLKEVTVGGSPYLEYAGRVLKPANPRGADGDAFWGRGKVEEASGISHATRGLLTRRRTDYGPSFEVTLAEATQLDGSGAVVFGRVLDDGEGFLGRIEAVPTYSYKAAEASGSFVGALFDAQKRAYTDMAKGLGDDRLEDMTGKLLRKVEVRQVTLL